MSYYSSKDQPPQPSGWSHRTYATDFWAHQAIWQLKDDHDSQQSSAAKKWMVPCITHKWSIVQPFTDVNVLSRFIISSDPFSSKHSFPVHLVRQAWYGNNPSQELHGVQCYRPGRTQFRYSLFWVGERNLESVCNGLERGFANQFHNECISL